MRCSLSGMGCNGALKETIKMVSIQHPNAAFPQSKD
jgi:hypothetical protein